MQICWFLVVVKHIYTSTMEMKELLITFVIGAITLLIPLFGMKKPMSPEMTAKLKRSLVFHERREKFIYTDSVGKLTGGIGYNFTDRGLPDWFIDRQYDEDVSFFYDQLNKNFSWFSELNEDRQIVLIDMCFMGFKKFTSFKNMIAALEKNDYELAAKEMLDSKWATQVGQRAIDLAEGMRHGEYRI